MIGVDSLSLTRKLESAGFSQNQAEEIAKLVEVTTRLCFADFVRIADLETLRIALLQDNTLIIHDLKHALVKSKNSMDSLSISIENTEILHKSKILSTKLLISVNIVLISAIVICLYMFMTNN